MAESPSASNTSTSTSKEAARIYKSHSEYQIRVGQTLVSLSGVVKGEKVLDLGCGTGHFATVLSDLVGSEGRVVAVDPDQERITIATESYGRPNIEYSVADDQTFPGEDYNLVFANHVIHWIKDKVPLFKNLYKRLCSGGKFAFSTFDGAPKLPSDIMDICSAFGGPDFYQKLACEFQNITFETADNYSKLAKSAGFMVTKIEKSDSLEEWKNFKELVYCLHGSTHGRVFDVSALSEESLSEYQEKNNLGSISFRFTRKLLYILVTKP